VSPGTPRTIGEARARYGSNAVRRGLKLGPEPTWRHATINDGNTPADRKTIAAAEIKRERKAAARLAAR
jgi:hypothetical protein